MARFIIRPAFAALLLICAIPGARAESPAWPVPFAAPRTPAAVRYDAAIWKSVPAGYLDDAPACVLYSGTTQRLEADGTTESTTLELIRLNGRKGIDQLGEYRNITFAPAYETVTLHAARVHKANGKVTDVEARHVQLRDVNTDHQVYDPSKQVVISFPGLEVGDVMEVHWTTRGRNPEYQGQLFARYSFGSDKYPVVRDEWCVRVPKSRELKYATINGDVPTTEAIEGDERIYRWVATGCPIPPQGDHLPSAEEFHQQVACSTFASWDEVYRWNKNLIGDRCRCTPEVQALVDEITRGLTEPEKKARALAQWVRRNIRYVSSGDKHDYTPYPPARSLTNRAGDCKDTALLYCVMARAAGLQAAFATLGTRGDGQVIETVPSPWGTHAIAVVTIDGRDHWIDLTVNLIGWDTLPRDDRGRLCHAVNDQGIRLIQTPAHSADDNRTEHRTVIDVTSSGTGTAERTSLYVGTAAWTKRDDFVDTPKTECRRLLTAELLDAYSKAKLHDLHFGDSLRDLDKPFSVQSSFELPDFAGDDAILSDQLMWTQLLSINIDPERKTAYDLGEPFESKQRFVLRLAPTHCFVNLAGCFPDRPTNVKSEWGSFTASSTSSVERPHEMVVEFHTRINKTRIEPKDFEAFTKFQASVQVAYRARIPLKPTKDIADAKPIEALLAASPKDLVTATTLASLYLKHDQVGEAVRVLGEARRHHPDDRKLWEMSLEAVDDLEGREELLRTMAGKFANDPEVALELGGNLVEQSKHAEATQVLEPLTVTSPPAIQRQAWLLLAASALVQEEPKKALRHLQAAEKADAEGFDAAAWRLKGDVHEALHEPRLALQAFKKALAQDPDVDEWEGIILAVVRLATATGARAEALSHLHQYRAAIGDDPEGLAHFADAAVRLGRFDDALDTLVQLRSSNHALPAGAERPLGIALAHRGHFEQAMQHLEKADLDAEVLEKSLDSLIALGRLADAERQAKRLSQVDDPSPVLRRTIDDVHALVRRRDQLQASKAPSGPGNAVDVALERFVCAEHLHHVGLLPDRVTALINMSLANDIPLGPALGLRAELHLERGRLTRALADAERAIELCPDDARGFLARGRVRLERGTPGALADLERAAQLSQRQDGTILHFLAAALREAGRAAEAVQTQELALKLRPEDPEIRAQLREFAGIR